MQASGDIALSRERGGGGDFYQRCALGCKHVITRTTHPRRAGVPPCEIIPAYAVGWGVRRLE